MLKVLRFRLGCSTLPSVAQRNQGFCRAERVCPCCDQGALGDEYLFECPATRAARAPPFAHLFLPTMLAFNRNQDTSAVAKCILACVDEVELITELRPSAANIVPIHGCNSLCCGECCA